MKPVKFLFVLWLFCTGLLHAQEPKIHVDKKGKVGFVDNNGAEVVKCIYDSAFPFNDGVAIVTKAGKSGIIDATGNVLLPLKYTQISSWSDKLYLIKNGKVMGLSDKKGNVVLEPKYSMISKPNCYGKAIIALGGKSTAVDRKTYMLNAKYGIIDTNGNIIIGPTYRGLFEFAFDGSKAIPMHEGERLLFNYHCNGDTLLTDCSYLGFSKNGFSIYKCGIMDGTGKEILPLGKYDFVMKPKSNMVRYYIVKKKETLCGYYNINNSTSFESANFNQGIDNIKFWTHGDFIGEIAPVNGERWHFIDKSGKTVREGYSSLIHSETTKLWAAKSTSDTWDVFDDSNNSVASLSGYSNILFPTKKGDEEIFTVQKENKYGAISKEGKTIVPFEYDNGFGCTYGIIALAKQGKWGVVNTNNQTLIPFEYTSIVFPEQFNANDFWVLTNDSLYHHFKVSTQHFSDTAYKGATNFHDGLSLATPVNLELDDTQVNKSQVYVPNTSQSTIAAVDLSKYIMSFGYLLNDEDQIVFDQPISTLYKDAVIKELKDHDMKSLNEWNKKSILLDVTRENRSYDLKSTLNEDEWNY